MKILITGATGFIGGNLAEKLVSQGHEVSALVRPGSKTAGLAALGAALVRGDVIDASSLHAITAPFDVIVHCAARVRNDDPRALYAANVIGTENICRLAERLRVRRLVYLSSVAVISGNPQVPLVEDLPYSPTNRYGVSKVAAEEKVIDFRNRGLPVAILRPPMVYGEHEPHLLGTLLFLLKHRLLPVIGSAQARLHLAYVGNVVDALVLALDSSAMLSGTFFVADNEVLTVREVFSVFVQAIKAPQPLILPQALGAVIRTMPGLNTAAEFFSKDRVCDISRIRAAGYQGAFQARQALFDSARFWLDARSRE